MDRIKNYEEQRKLEVYSTEGKTREYRAWWLEYL
jgi:hypothetical protein